MRRQEDGEAKRVALVQEDNLGQPAVAGDIVELLVAVHVDVHAFRCQPVAGQVEVVILEAPGGQRVDAGWDASVSMLSLHQFPTRSPTSYCFLCSHQRQVGSCTGSA